MATVMMKEQRRKESRDQQAGSSTKAVCVGTKVLDRNIHGDVRSTEARQSIVAANRSHTYTTRQV